MRKNTEQDFWKNIKKTPNGCWEWQMSLTRGYGTFSINGKSYRAHRYAYKISKGELLEGLIIRHLCNNRKCVNPDHLEQGTHRDNKNDSIIAGTHAHGEHHYKATLTDKDVINIARSLKTNRELAQEYGVTHSMIGYIKRGESWKHLNIKRIVNNKPKGITQELFKNIKDSDGSLRKIASKFNVSPSLVFRIKNNKKVIIK